MLVTQKEYATLNGLNYASVRSAVSRGKLPYTTSPEGKKLIDTETKWNGRSANVFKRSGRLYGIWNGIKFRCYNPNSGSYKYYGGRGIKMCDEWRNSFDAFALWATENGYKEKLSIDRIDSDGDYEPSNCQWLTVAENSRKAVEDTSKKKDRNRGYFIPTDIPIMLSLTFDLDFPTSTHLVDNGRKILQRTVDERTGIVTWREADEATYKEWHVIRRGA